MSSPKLKMQTLHFLSICSYPVCSGVSCHAQLGPSSMLFFLLKCHIPYWYRQQGRASSTVVQRISAAGSSLRGEGWKADSIRVHLEGMRMRTRMLGSQNCQIGQANFRCISGFWGCCFLFFFLSLLELFCCCCSLPSRSSSLQGKHQLFLLLNL